eukprot:m.49644 g.49644  ORF g.49644 m.49644 type:complete len:119 (+) comp16171_c0_seq2:48-404(+)
MQALLAFWTACVNASSATTTARHLTPLSLGHGRPRCARYTLEVQDGTSKTWTLVPLDTTVSGQTIGAKAIVVLPTLSNASALRLRCTKAVEAVDAVSGVTITSISAHRLAAPQTATPL